MKKLCQRYGHTHCRRIKEAQRENIVRAISPTGTDVVVHFDPISLRAIPIITIQNTSPSDNIQTINTITVVTNIPSTLSFYLISETGKVDGMADCALIEFNYAKGANISALWEDDIVLSEMDLTHIAYQIYSGLHSAHTSGYINGDLGNPENVLVDLQTLHVTVIDFESTSTNNATQSNDMKEAALLVWRCITGGNDSFEHNGRIITYTDELFATLFARTIDNYPQYTTLLTILCDVFDDVITSACCTTLRLV